MTVVPAIAYNRFAEARDASIVSAAARVGLRADTPPTVEQFAHLAWHVAVVDPSELRSLLPRVLPHLRREKLCAGPHRVALDPLDELLPLPHPLDFEWRYDPHTRAMLAHRCEALAGSGGSVALLGTPTLVPSLQGRVRHLLFVDTNAKVTTALGNAGLLEGLDCSVADLGGWAIPRPWLSRADVVLCDPPWYPEALATFIQAASRIIRPGGTVLLSLPDVLTRPSAAHELGNLRTLSERLGLTTSCMVRIRAVWAAGPPC